MQILLSPAKDMTDSPSVSLPSLTTPLFLAEAEHNAEQMSELSTEELSQLLKINPQLAALNKQRYTDFPALTPQAAVLSYTGMAYRHLRAAEFSPEDLAYAQQHFWMTSFLYGLLRPLDGIKNYRLEGNVVLPEHDGQTMFQFWRTRLTNVLIDESRRWSALFLRQWRDETAFRLEARDKGSEGDHAYFPSDGEW
mgnify:CR=1 FL=1